MKERTKLRVILVICIVVIVLIFAIPGFGLLAALGILIVCGYQKTKHIPIATRRRRRK